MSVAALPFFFHVLGPHSIRLTYDYVQASRWQKYAEGHFITRFRGFNEFMGSLRFPWLSDHPGDAASIRVGEDGMMDRPSHLESGSQ